jgi:hypothetical protein
MHEHICVGSTLVLWMGSVINLVQKTRSFHLSTLLLLTCDGYSIKALLELRNRA